MQEHVFNTQSVTLNYIEEGKDAPTILLLHGGTGRWQSFLSIIPDLSDYLHVYAVDLRGHGKSFRSDSYTLQDHVQDVFLFIKEQIKRPTIIFGHSLGGMIAMMLAATHPEWVEAIILGDAPLTLEALRKMTGSQQDAAKEIVRLLREKEYKKIFDTLKNDQLAECIVQCDPEAINAMFLAFDPTFGDYKTDALFPLVRCSTLILRGEPSRGSLVSDTDLNNTLKLCSNCSSVQIPNVGHGLFIEDKTSVLNAIKTFIIGTSRVD